MNEKFEARLQELARKDEENRHDLRFVDTMGFLIAKGLLGYNRPIVEKPNAKLDLRDVIWAGVNVEPRILEVLPAAFIRFEKHFRVAADPNSDERKLLEVRGAVKKKAENFPDFMGIPYKKYAVWIEFPLRDRRTRLPSERKKMKAFRLRPDAIEKLAKIAKECEMSEAEVLEELIGKRA